MMRQPRAQTPSVRSRRSGSGLAWLPLLLGCLVLGSGPAPAPQGPSVLLVTAHPDDEAMFAAAVYRVTHGLDGTVDLALVTDGSGGFRYADLAEPIYGLELTDETIARHHLPAIRKKELMASGEILGVRNYFFLDQLDHAYTENIDTVLSHVWDADEVRGRLREIMQRVRYDFVFVHLPVLEFHAHHKAATILTLEAVSELPEANRPVVLGSFVGSRADSVPDAPAQFVEHPGYPISRVRTDLPPFTFDRMQPVGSSERLNYQIIVNWAIAEHKSQGTMQLLINRGEVERFWLFAMDGPAALGRTRDFFRRLNGSS